MASASPTTLSVSSSSTLVDAKPPRQSAAGSPQCVTLPTVPPPPLLQPQSRPWKATTYCRKLARNVMAMATGEAPAEVAPNELELQGVVKTVTEAWNKVEDKYAVTSLGVAAVFALWISTGMISAIDVLPLFPGALELVGIGYTGWFAYKNIVFKPDREALIQKIKDTYDDIIGSS